MEHRFSESETSPAKAIRGSAANGSSPATRSANHDYATCAIVDN